MSPSASLRVGIGTDFHVLRRGRKFVLAGVVVEEKFGPEGFSDADPLTHSIIDALLGATGGPDIGELFPPGDLRWKDASSLNLLKIVLDSIEKNWKVLQVDSVLHVDRPQLAPFKKEIVRAISNILKAPFNLKFKTFESKFKRAAFAISVCLVEKIDYGG